ncbi:MAG: hypothetical protein MZV64_30040 [Ignavibacteriales bacterium]|nr:hypothetical protein [Ignavibacteriales bacterium]
MAMPPGAELALEAVAVGQRLGQNSGVRRPSGLGMGGERAEPALMNASRPGLRQIRSN